MNANTIYNDEMKKYTVERLVTSVLHGIQENSKTPFIADLAIYDKGTKSINVKGEDSYIISIIHIYCDSALLEIHDEIPFNNLTYRILDMKDNLDFSFYRAVSNV